MRAPSPPAARAPAAARAAITVAIAKDIERLKALPAPVQQAIRLLADPDVNLRRLSDVLAADQVIAAQIIRHANSAAYGGIATCATIADGIIRVGTRQLKSVLYGVAAVGPLTARLAGYRFNDGELYRHSAAVAGVSRWLAFLVRYREPEEAYAAGLLHDIGKLVLDRHIRPHAEQMTQEIVQLGRTQIAVEERYAGTDHATVGGLIGERWNYPAVLVEAIRSHHAPTLANAEPRLAAIVHLANALVLQSGIGLTPWGVPELNPAVYEILHLRENDLGNIAYEMRRHIEEADRDYQTRYTGPLRPLATR